MSALLSSNYHDLFSVIDSMVNSDWIRDSGLPKALLSQQTRIAMPARLAARRRVVAGGRQSEIQAELRGSSHDLRLRLSQQRRTDPESLAALHAGPRSESRHSLERLQELRPAVRIPGVVERVGADEDVEQPESLGPRH